MNNIPPHKLTAFTSFQDVLVQGTCQSGSECSLSNYYYIIMIFKVLIIGTSMDYIQLDL